MPSPDPADIKTAVDAALAEDLGQGDIYKDDTAIQHNYPQGDVRCQNQQSGDQRRA